MSNPFETIQKVYDRFFGATQEQPSFPNHPVLPYEDAHYDSRQYFPYVDRHGNLHQLHRTWNIGPASIREDVEHAKTFILAPHMDLIDEEIIKYTNSIYNMDSTSQVEIFLSIVREDHQYPDLTKPSVAKDLGVSTFTYSWNEQGYYRLTFVGFKDGSSWER